MNNNKRSKKSNGRYDFRPSPAVIKTVSDFQRKTKPTFDEIVSSESPIMVMNRSKMVGVFLNPDIYRRILEDLEDYLDSIDLQAAMARSKRLNEKSYSLDEVKELLHEV